MPSLIQGWPSIYSLERMCLKSPIFPHLCDLFLFLTLLTFTASRSRSWEKQYYPEPYQTNWWLQTVAVHDQVCRKSNSGGNEARTLFQPSNKCFVSAAQTSTHISGSLIVCKSTGLRIRASQDQTQEYAFWQVFQIMFTPSKVWETLV